MRAEYTSFSSACKCSYKERPYSGPKKVFINLREVKSCKGCSLTAKQSNKKSSGKFPIYGF